VGRICQKGRAHERPAPFHAAIQIRTVAYIPAGWYAASVIPEWIHVRPWTGPWDYAGGRTAAEATAAARRLYPGSSPEQVEYARDGYFRAGM
jgi:hypothetical protein